MGSSDQRNISLDGWTEEGDIVVWIAELEVDPAQREGFISAVKEEMKEAVRVDPGVLAVYAVAEKDTLPG